VTPGDGGADRINISTGRAFRRHAAAGGGRPRDRDGPEVSGFTMNPTTGLDPIMSDVIMS